MRDSDQQPLSLTLGLPGPVNLAQTRGHYRMGAGDPCLRVQDGSIWRATRTPLGPGTEHISLLADGSVHVEAWGPGAAWLLEHAPALCGALDTPETFQPEVPLLQHLVRVHPGLRIGRTLSVFETAMLVTLEQRVATHDAWQSWRQLVRGLGEPAPGWSPDAPFRRAQSFAHRSATSAAPATSATSGQLSPGLVSADYPAGTASRAGHSSAAHISEGCDASGQASAAGASLACDSSGNGPVARPERLLAARGDHFWAGPKTGATAAPGDSTAAMADGGAALFEPGSAAAMADGVAAAPENRSAAAAAATYGLSAVPPRSRPMPVGANANSLWLPPSPERIARTPYEVFHRFGVERRRAEIIRHLAVVARRLEETAAMPLDDAYRRLRAITGVGPWTAARTALIALGDPDAVPLGDLHIPHMVTWALAGERRGSDERMLELLEPFRGHRGRVIRLMMTGARSRTAAPLAGAGFRPAGPV